MTLHVLKKGICYSLTSGSSVAQIIEIHHATGEVDYVLLPFDAFSNFLTRPLPHDAEIRGDTLKINRAGTSLWQKIRGDTKAARILTKSRFAAPVRYGGCIYSYDRPVKGPPRQSLLDNRGMDLGSESITTLLSSEMILDVVPELPFADAPAPEFSGKIAIVLHLHYTELWDEFATFFRHSKLSFRLFVTLTHENPDLSVKIEEAFPDAKILVVENLGRDVRPFVKVLKSGLLDDVDLICKLHAKRSIASGVTGARFGHLWRRRALLDLMGSPKQVQSILDRFKARPKLGLLGPATLRLKNGSGIDPGFAASKPIREELCVEAGLDASHIQEDFFAGTMFWVRRSALEPVRRLSLGPDIFTDETVQKGDQFEHALERFFADCVRAEGYALADVEPLALVSNDVQLYSDDGEILAPFALFEAPRHFYASNWVSPLPEDVSGRKIVLTTKVSSLKQYEDQGWLTCFCYSFHEAVAGSSDALFRREAGGFEMALFADALNSNPALWDSDQLKLVMEAETITLSREHLQKSALRMIFEDVLVWRKRSEVEHRSLARLKALLRN